MQAAVSGGIRPQPLSVRWLYHVLQERTHNMLRLALFFLVVSLVAALFGFGGLSAAAADIAHVERQDQGVAHGGQHAVLTRLRECSASICTGYPRGA